MTSLWRARLYELRLENLARGRLVAIGSIVTGLILLALLQNLFAVAAAAVGLGFLALWGYAVFTHPLKRALWQKIAVVGGGVVLAVGYALWRGSPVPALAAGAIVTLVVRAYRCARTPVDADSPGPAAYLRVLMLLAYAGLLFAWPRLGTYLLVIICAGTIIFIATRALVRSPSDLRAEATAIRDDAARHRRERLSSARLTGRIVLALGTAGAVAASFFIFGGASQRQPGEFYAAPSELPASAGELIRSEPYTRGVPEGQQGWLILYSTTDFAGEPTVGSAVVIAPKTRGGGPLPSVSVAPGTNGVVPHCATSLKDNVFVTGHEQAVVEHLIPAGWAAVITDYSGLGTAGPHAYMDGGTAAHNVLDSRLAAAQISDLELEPTTVVWGHSQGGNTALWAANIAAQYTDDLEVLGAAAAAPAADLPTIFTQVANDPAGKIITSYLLTSWQNAFDIPADELRTPGYSQVVERIANNCFEGRDAVASLAETTQLSSPIIRQFSAEFSQLLDRFVPPAKYAVPVFVGQGDADQLIGAGQQSAFVDTQCAAGAILDYRIYPGRDHMPLVAADSPYLADLISWTKDRQSGVSASKECGVITVQ